MRSQKVTNPDIIADDHARASFEKDVEDEIISDTLFDTTKGKRNWRALCISNLATSDQTTQYSFDGARLPVKLMLLDTIENILPDPCDLRFGELETKKIVSYYPTGFSQQPYNSRYKLPSFGDIVRVNFTDNGPANLGKHRGIQYNFVTSVESSVYTCANKNIVSHMVSFVGNRGMMPMGTYKTEVSNGTKIKGAFNFTWSDLLELGALGVFEPILKNIREHECSTGGCAKKQFNGNQYDAYNTDGGAGYGMTKYLPKPLSQYSIEQVRSYWQGTPSVKGKHMFATGGYQIIPKTLRSAIDRIKDLDTALIYNKTNQDALGIYLVTMKRSHLGKYLFGANVDAAYAGNELAFEFASIRLQKPANRKDKKTGTVIRLPAYVKYYGGVGVNKQGAVDKADADETMAAINAVRQAIDNSPAALAIRDRVMKK